MVTIEEKKSGALHSKKVELMNVAGNFRMLGLNFHLYKRDEIPSSYEVLNVESENWLKLLDEVKKICSWKPENEFRWDEYILNGKKMERHIVHLDCGITLFKKEDNDSVILYFDSRTDHKLVDRIRAMLESAVSDQPTFQIGYLNTEFNELTVKFRGFQPYEEDLTEYLGEEVVRLRKRIIEEMNASAQSGLYLLHGEPGTGKTSFLKSILASVEKQAIFISPALTDDLTSPSLIGLLMDYPGSVIIIEDAETVLMKRQADNSNAVANLLNLTDGFPADFLNLNIICTFNTQIDNIDPALLREGRLKALHRFKKLNPQQAAKLADHLDLEVEPGKSMTLAEVCNGGGTTMINKSENGKSPQVGFVG